MTTWLYFNNLTLHVPGIHVPDKSYSLCTSLYTRLAVYISIVISIFISRFSSHGKSDHWEELSLVLDWQFFSCILLFWLQLLFYFVIYVNRLTPVPFPMGVLLWSSLCLTAFVFRHTFLGNLMYSVFICILLHTLSFFQCFIPTEGALLRKRFRMLT